MDSGLLCGKRPFVFLPEAGEHGQSRRNTDKYGRVTITIGKEQLLDKIRNLSYNNRLCRRHKK